MNVSQMRKFWCGVRERGSGKLRREKRYHEDAEYYEPEAEAPVVNEDEISEVMAEVLRFPVCTTRDQDEATAISLSVVLHRIG